MGKYIGDNIKSHLHLLRLVLLDRNYYFIHFSKLISTNVSKGINNISFELKFKHTCFQEVINALGPNYIYPVLVSSLDPEK
jgi:hypothetical protein